MVANCVCVCVFQLLDNVENKMKGTCVEGTIPKLFRGKMVVGFLFLHHIFIYLFIYSLSAHNSLMSPRGEFQKRRDVSFSCAEAAIFSLILQSYVSLTCSEY